MTDTTTTLTSETRAAVRGTWVAAMLTPTGWPTSDMEDVGLIRVALAGHEQGPASYPGSVIPDEVLYEITVFGDDAEVITRWAQAQAVAGLLNAANNQPDRG